MDDVVAHLQDFLRRSMVGPLRVWFSALSGLLLPVLSPSPPLPPDATADAPDLRQLVRLSKRIIRLQRKLVDDDVQFNSKTRAHIRHTFLRLYIPIENEYITVKNKSIFVNGRIDAKLTSASMRILRVFNEYDSLVTSCVFYKIRKGTSTSFVFLLRRLLMDVKYANFVAILNKNFTALQIKVSYLSKMYAVDLDRPSCGTTFNGVWKFDVEKLGRCIVNARPKVGFEFIFLLSEKLCLAYGILDDVTPHALCQNLMATVAITECADRYTGKRF
jgi:hypothetical protein